jgi:hypothetical protein
MNSKTKKTIAKEIIYFFSVISFLLLAWAGIELRNSFLRNKMDNFSNQISVLKIQIDSIEKTYPKKAIEFSNLVPPVLPTLDELNNKALVSIDDANAQLDDSFVESPISELYGYLRLNKFDFAVPGAKEKKPFILNNAIYDIPIDEIKNFLKDYPSAKPSFEKFIPDLESFENHIKKEFNQPKQPLIQKIYAFIKSENKKFTSDILNFVFCLKGLPPLPPLEILDKLDEIKKTKTETNQKLKETENKLMYRNETKSFIVWSSTLLLGLLYPFRFIFFLLKWAFKTVKQKE